MSARSWCCAVATAAATACSSPEMVWGPSLKLPWDPPRPEHAAATPPYAPFNEADFVLRGRLLEALAEVEVAMEPVCAPHCGQVRLIAVDELGSLLAMTPEEPGQMSNIYFDPLRAWPRDGAGRPFLVYAVGHEYGHHLDVTMQRSATRDRWSRELRAEALAGCALVRANADPTLVLAVMQSSQAAAGSVSAARELTQGSDEEHPALLWSMRALAAGARACAGRSPIVAELTTLGQRIANEAHECAETRRCR